VTGGVDILLVSLGTTRGLRLADAWLVALLREAGVSVAATRTSFGLADRLRRGYPANDLVEAIACRRALRAARSRHRPHAVILSSTTAALLAGDRGVPFAVRLDAPAALNRPGALTAPVRALERQSLTRARLVLATSAAGAAALPPGSAPAVVVPVPIESAGEASAGRGRVAVAYTPDPQAKGLDLLAAAWAQAGLDDARLDVFGLDPEKGRRHLERSGVPEPAGLCWRGSVAPEAFRDALRGARTFVTAARWEDFGQAQLEALSDGAVLTTLPSPGPFAALALARELSPELVAEEGTPAALARALRAAFALPDEHLEIYRSAAQPLLAPYRPGAVARTLRDDVLPVLLG